MVNPYNKYIKQYQTNNITTATPEKLMVMLFDGAIQFLQKAKTAIEENNLKEININHYLPEFDYSNELSADMIEYLEYCLEREV